MAPFNGCIRKQFCDLPILITALILSGILVPLLLVDEDDGAQDDHLRHDAQERPQRSQLVWNSQHSPSASTNLPLLLSVTSVSETLYQICVASTHLPLPPSVTSLSETVSTHRQHQLPLPPSVTSLSETVSTHTVSINPSSSSTSISYQLVWNTEHVSINPSSSTSISYQLVWNTEQAPSASTHLPILLSVTNLSQTLYQICVANNQLVWNTGVPIKSLCEIFQ